MRARTPEHRDDPRGSDRLGVGLHPFHTYSLRIRVFISHLPLTVTMVAIALLVWLVADSFFPNTLYMWGVIGVGVLTVASVALPWDRFPHPTFLVLPLLDLVAVGAVMHGASSFVSGTSGLFMFPVLWLAWSWIAPRLMRILAFVVPFLISYAPFYLGRVELTLENAVKPLLVPVITFCVCVAATYVNSEAQVQHEELEKQYETVRKQRRLLEAILDAAPVGVFVIDENGRELLRNPQQQRLQRLALPEGVPADEAELVLHAGPERTPVAAENRPVRRASRGERLTGERLYLGSGADERALNVSARPLLDDDGQFAGSVLVFHDVTDLVAALAAQEEFVSSISHEFRTPLTSIIGYTDLLIDDESDDVITQRGLRVVQRNADRLLGLVDDLLGTASGVPQVERNRVDILGVARDGVEAAAPQATAAGLTLIVEGDEPAVVMGDRMKLAQVLDNLVANAIKYTDGPTVVVRAGQRDGYGVLEVEDRGPGLTEVEQRRIFERFYRTESARASAVPGSGLGMAVVRAVVEAHDGLLVVDSEPGRGTRMIVQIPLAH